MKKLLLFIFPAFLMTPFFALSQASGSVDLGSEITNGITTGGCAGTCLGTVCFSAGSGNHAVETINLTITGIPAGNSAEIIINSINCNSTSGLDGGDNIFINGNQVFTGSGNTLVNNLITCVEGGSDIVVTFTVNRRDETINVTWDSGLTDPGAGCFLAPAPVTLSQFSAKLQNQSVQLNWTTESEANNDGFVVEHSTDGVDFSAIEQIKGAGTAFAANSYEYLHESPAKGRNYYRLAQVDFDGKISYSPVTTVMLEDANTFKLYPTLAKDAVYLSFADANINNATVEVFDLMGRPVIQKVVNGDETNWTLDIADLQNGHYLVRMQAASKVYSARFIKN